VQLRIGIKEKRGEIHIQLNQSRRLECSSGSYPKAGVVIQVRTQRQTPCGVFAKLLIVINAHRCGHVKSADFMLMYSKYSLVAAFIDIQHGSSTEVIEFLVIHIHANNRVAASKQ